jgi:branched-chain amino acid transport system substrate-binding protein
LQGIRGAGLQQAAIGGEALATADLIRQTGEAVNGMYVSSTWHPEVSGEISENFVSAYVAAHGRQPEHFAAESHAAIYVLVDAVRRAGNTSPEAIKDALASTRELDTVLGSLSMSPEGDAVFQPVFQQFQSGRLSILR